MRQKPQLNEDDLLAIKLGNNTKNVDLLSLIELKYACYQRVKLDLTGCDLIEKAKAHRQGFTFYTNENYIPFLARINGYEIMAALLEARSLELDPNAVSLDGEAAIFMAVEKDHPKVIEALLHYGATTKVKNK